MKATKTTSKPRGHKFEKTLADRSPEERREIARKGGLARAAQIKESKRLQQIIDEVWQRTETENGEVLTLKEKAVLKAAKQAAKGNLEALALLAKLNGESKDTLQVQALPPVQMNAFGFDD